MCCESRGDVGRALALLAQRASELDAIVVETSGVSDPLGVADLLAHGVFPTDLRLSQVVTVVDAENFDRNLADAEAAYSQIVSADLFVVGKSDLVAPEVVTAIGERLARLNPRAAVLPSDGGRSAAGLLGEVAGVPRSRPSGGPSTRSPATTASRGRSTGRSALSHCSPGWRHFHRTSTGSRRSSGRARRTWRCTASEHA